MRIGLITGEYPPLRGGVGDYSYALAGELAAQGHEVHVLARPQAQDTRAGIVVHNTMRHWGLTALPIIRRWIIENRLNVVSLQYQTAIYDMSGWMHFLPRVSPVPIITTFHDLLVPYLFPKAGNVRNWIVRELARTSAAAVTTNQEDNEQLKELPHTHLIPIGSNIEVAFISVEARQQLRSTVNAQHDFLIAHFGFLYPNRGVEHLLEALKQLRDNGTNAHLVIIGGRESGPTQPAYVAQLDNLITSLHLRSYITWTGFVEQTQVSQWLQSVDVVALPFLDGASYRRGSLIAAIMHSCAIVTTQPNGRNDTLRDHENLSLIPVGDSTALFIALRELATNPLLRKRYQDQIATLRSSFHWTSIARDFVRVFEEAKRV